MKRSILVSLLGVLHTAHGKQKQLAVESAPPYRDALLALHKSLVEIPSTSGSEPAVGSFLASYLEARGYHTRLQVVSDDPRTRFNVIASRGDTDNDNGTDTARVLLTSHLDTVPPHIAYRISDEHVCGDTVVAGRGSVDAKGSVAAQITAAETLVADGEIGAADVVLAYVVGEETDGDGMRAFSADARRPRFGAAIFGEPTAGRLVCGHKGLVSVGVTATGRAGHSGYPWLGKSATEVLMRALVRLLDADLGSSARFGNSTVNVGVLAGGVAANVLAGNATAQILVRIGGGKQATGEMLVRDRLEAIFRDVDPHAFKFEYSNGYGPVECECAVDGFETVVVNYGTDVPNLVGNHTRYLYGPGSIFVAHGDDEALTVRDLETAVEGYKTLIKHALARQR